MDFWTRRKFLLASGVVGASALAGGAARVSLPSILERRFTLLGKTLVLVTLYGGNDGLNTVIPFEDPLYHHARPDLSYQPDEVLHLEGELGLNPALTGFARHFAEGRVAIVRGVG